MRKLKLLFIFLILSIFATSGFAKKDLSVSEAEVNKFYDSLMQLVSYDKYRDFYDDYIEKLDISYENFVKEIKTRGIMISGGYDSKLIGWQRKGKKVVITIETKVDNEGVKRLHLALDDKKEGLKISAKEFFKLCKQKNVKIRRRTK